MINEQNDKDGLQETLNKFKIDYKLPEIETSTMRLKNREELDTAGCADRMPSNALFDGCKTDMKGKPRSPQATQGKGPEST